MVFAACVCKPEAAAAERPPYLPTGKYLFRGQYKTYIARPEAADAAATFIESQTEEFPMKLYYTPGVCSLSPHIAMREAGLPVELAKVDLGTKKLDDGSDYTAINPKGYVPGLVLPNGELLTEGVAIVQYIADQNPDSRLAPKAGTLERVRLQEWLTYISSELHKSFSPLFNKTASADWKASATAKLHKAFDYVSSQLGSKPYLFGEQFTVADGYLFTVLSWTNMVKVSLDKWPTLIAFQTRVSSRPKVQEALKAEGLLK
jgi:glutathione S-transferase